MITRRLDRGLPRPAERFDPTLHTVGVPVSAACRTMSEDEVPAPCAGANPYGRNGSGRGCETRGKTKRRTGAGAFGTGDRPGSFGDPAQRWGQGIRRRMPKEAVEEEAK